MNKRQRGNLNKKKTIKWLQGQGWQAFDCELNKICYFGGRLAAVHKDLLGADIIALNGKDILFVQSKTNKQDILDGIYEFQKYPFPDFVKRIVVCWELRARAPIIREVDNLAVLRGN